MATLARLYLIEKIGLIFGPASRDGVIEQLLVYDCTTQQDEMVACLERIGGSNPKFRAIVKQYALLEKNLGQGGASGPPVASVDRNVKKNRKGTSELPGGGKIKTAESKTFMDRNCGCMATKHSLFGNCCGCGRIYCEEEQISVCKYCSDRVWPCMSGDEAEAAGRAPSTVAAYRHKVMYYTISIMQVLAYNSSFSRTSCCFLTAKMPKGLKCMMHRSDKNL